MLIRHKVLPAVGLVALLAAGAAQAAGPVPAGNEYHISGSTALDNQIKDALLLPSTAGGPCNSADPVYVYTDAPVLGSGGNITKSHQVVVICTLAKAIGGITAGTVVGFNKESNGGSNEGTYYPATQNTLAFLDLTQTPTGCTSVGAIAAGTYWTHQQAITTEYDGCTGVIIQAIPDVGVADEDPALFNVGLQAISSAEIAKLNTTPLFQNQFAIAVSLNLYRALQRAQGLTLDDTLANMPRMTRAQISAIYAQAITSWQQVVSSTGVAINNTTYTNGVTIPNQVYLCRRGDNSGTNVSADVFFLRNRCSFTPSSGILTAVGPAMATVTSGSGSPCAGLPGGQTAENNGCTWTNGAAPTGNLSDTVFGGAATADVISCLHQHSINGTFAIGHSGATSKFDDPLGLETGSEPGSNHFRYIAIDGNKPTVAGMANGTWSYAFDNVENVWTGLTGNKLSVANFLGTLFQSTTALSDILVAQPNAQNSSHVVDANYVTGGLVDAAVAATVNTPPVSTATVESNPVSALTYYATGAVNNCQVLFPLSTSLSKEIF